VGVVDHVLIDPETHHPAYLVVRGGEVLPKDTLVPVKWIRDVDEEGVLLDATLDQLRMLPEYTAPQSDAQIDAALTEVLSRCLRSGPEKPPVVVRVEQGVVWLIGTVASEAQRRAVLAAVRRLPGVWEVRDELTVEKAVEKAAEEAVEEAPERSERPGPAVPAEGTRRETRGSGAVLVGEGDDD
jgi:hypothetical protein